MSGSGFVIRLENRFIATVDPNKSVTSTDQRARAARFDSEDAALVRRAGLNEYWQKNSVVEPFEVAP